jgi:c-di-GMP-related signal transduction protein
LEKFLARQPIFNSNRVSLDTNSSFARARKNFFDASHPDVACASATESLLLFGIERLTQGRRALTNCTRRFLIRDTAAMLPKDRVVLEILESVRPDDKVLAACRRLKQAGYPIASCARFRTRSRHSASAAFAARFRS